MYELKHVHTLSRYHWLFQGYIFLCFLASVFVAMFLVVVVCYTVMGMAYKSFVAKVFMHRLQTT